MVQGAIEVQTRIDNSEVPKDAAELNKMLDDAKSHIMELAENLNLKVNPITIVDKDVMKAAEKEIAAISKQIAEIQKQTEKEINAVGVDNPNADIADTEAQIDAILEREKAEIDQLTERQNQLNQAVEEYKVKQVEITAERQRQKELATSETEAERQYNTDVRDVNSEVGANLAAESYVNQIQSLEEYESELERVQMRMQEIEAETERLAAERGINPDDALAANAEYQKLNKKLEALNNTTRKFKSTSKDTFASAKKSASSVGESVKGLIKQMSKYALAVFGARSAFYAIKNAIRQVLADNQQLTNTVNGIKGVFANALAPYVEKFVYYLQYALAYVNLFIKALTGVDMVANYNAKALKKQAEATKATAKATKEANNQLASFDEKNVLSSDKSNANSGGTAVENAAATLDLPDVSGGEFEQICETIKANLGEIEAFVGGVLIAVGLVLLVCGQIPLGIAAIIAGIALEAAAIGNADTIKNKTEVMLNTIMLIAGGLLLAIGLILVTVGQLPAGIAAIAIGVALLVSAIAMKVNEMPDKVQNTMLKIMGIAGAALLALGVILVLTGATVPLGIALIAAGAALLVTAIALAVDKMPSDVRNFLQVIFLAVSVAMLVLGIILLCTGVHLMLGVALLAAGAALLVTTIALNWNKLSDDTKKTLQVIGAIVSAALLVIGIILCCTGVALPLGIALIAAGAVGLVTIAALNKDTVKNWVSSAWASVKSFWSSKIAPIFTISWWSNKLRTIADGAKGAINTAITYVERGINWMVGKINGIGFNVPNWVPGIGGSRVGFNLPYVNIPRLAKGGIVNKPGKGVTATVGEAGKEAVLPLENNTEWMDLLAEKLAEKLSIPIINKFIIDGKEVHTSYNKAQARYNLATNGGVL